MVVPQPWFTRYADKVIAMDYEYVQKAVGDKKDYKVHVSRTGLLCFEFVPEKPRSLETKAAKVGLAWMNGQNQLYSVKHEANSFIINSHTLRVNGFPTGFSYNWTAV
jgi:hypothetical protein